MSISPVRVREMLVKEWRQIFRDPKSKRIIFASPILQLVLLGYAVNTDVNNTAMYVVDHDVSADSRALVDAFTAGGYFEVVGRSDRAADMASALDRGHARVGLEIPPGFSADLARRDAHVQLLLDGTNSNTATVAQGHATRIVQQFGAQHAPAMFPMFRPGTMPGQAPAAISAPGAAAISAPASMSGPGPGPGPGPISPGIDLRARAWFNPALESRVYNVPAVIGTILMLMSLLLTALAVVRERELGTLEQLMVSPLTPTELILGKTLPVAAIALIDLVIVVAVALLWFDIPLRGSVLALLVASVVYIIAALGIGLYISTTASTQQEAFMGMFLFFLPTAILSGFMYPVHTMPAVFQALTLINPLRHFLEIVRGIFLKGYGIFDILPQLGALSIMAVAIIWLAVRRFAADLRA